MGGTRALAIRVSRESFVCRTLVRSPPMKVRFVAPALLAVALLALSNSSAFAGLFSHGCNSGCCEPACGAPVVVADVCCEPAVCCPAPRAKLGCGLFSRLRAHFAAKRCGLGCGGGCCEPACGAVASPPVALRFVKPLVSPPVAHPLESPPVALRFVKLPVSPPVAPVSCDPCLRPAVA